MGSASLTTRGSHLHLRPVAETSHHGQEEGLHDPREEEEAEDPAEEEGGGGAEEGAGEEGRGEAEGDAERCGTKADLDSASMDDLKKICQQYFDKRYSLEGEMFFLQREVILRDLQINELTISVSDMKGKFIKPTLKKVSKYENKFAKLQEKAAKFAFANQLKQSKG